MAMVVLGCDFACAQVGDDGTWHSERQHSQLSTQSSTRLECSHRHCARIFFKKYARPRSSTLVHARPRGRASLDYTLNKMDF